MVYREFVSTNHLNHLAAEAFFEFIDTVWVVVVWEAVDAVEVVAFEVFLGSVFYHVPLEFVLGVVVLHILLIAAGEQINHLVAVEHKHRYG